MRLDVVGYFARGATGEAGPQGGKGCRGSKVSRASLVRRAGGGAHPSSWPNLDQVPAGQKETSPNQGH